MRTPLHTPLRTVQTPLQTLWCTRPPYPHMRLRGPSGAAAHGRWVGQEMIR